MVVRVMVPRPVRMMMPYAVSYGSDRGTGNIAEGKRAQHAARGNEQENLFHIPTTFLREEYSIRALVGIDLFQGAALLQLIPAAPIIVRGGIMSDVPFDQDAAKGAIETENHDTPGNIGLQQQLGHRDQDPMLKDADTDFPEPGENPEHSGEPKRKTA